MTLNAIAITINIASPHYNRQYFRPVACVCLFDFLLLLFITSKVSGVGEDPSRYLRKTRRKEGYLSAATTTQSKSFNNK